MNLRQRVDRLANRVAASRIGPMPDCDGDSEDARMADSFAEWATTGWFGDTPDFPDILAAYRRAIATHDGDEIASQRQRILALVEREVEAVVGPLTKTHHVLDLHQSARSGHLTPAVVIVDGRDERVECVKNHDR